jgi:hypothetical protein
MGFLGVQEGQQGWYTKATAATAVLVLPLLVLPVLLLPNIPVLPSSPLSLQGQHDPTKQPIVELRGWFTASAGSVPAANSYPGAIGRLE